ncbi:MAG: MFS transporter [Mycobacteriaceae bacterium]
MTSVGSRPAVRPTVVLAGVLLISLNLRAGLAAYPALIVAVRRELGISAGTAGLVQSAALVAMGLGSFAAVRLTLRLGRERAMTAAVVILLAGSALRLVPTLPALLVGSLSLGVGIGLAGVFLSGLVKEHLAERAGLVTGLYVVAMLLGSTVASQLMVPLSGALGSPTRALATLTVPVAVALAGWLPVAARTLKPASSAAAATAGLPWRSPLARVFAAYMVLSSAQFYGWLTWLAPYFTDRGLSDRSAATLLSLFSLAQIPAALAFPALAERRRRWLFWALVGVAVSLVGAAGVLLWPAGPLGPWPWVTLIALGVGAGFPMALTLVSWKSHTPAEASGATAVGLGVGYLGAAVAPLLMGVLRDATHSFTAPLLVLVVAAVLMGLLARPYHRVQPDN